MAAFWHGAARRAQGDGEMDRATGFVSLTRTHYCVSLHARRTAEFVALESP